MTDYAELNKALKKDLRFKIFIIEKSALSLRKLAKEEFINYLQR